jgi:hypothetical protein
MVKKALFVFLMMFLLSVGVVGAADEKKVVLGSTDLEATASATVSAEATASAKQIVPKQEDLTEPKEAKSRLEKVLESKEVGPLTWNNWLQVAVRSAVAQGVPVNTIVLIVLFPLVAALIAAARHILGLKGFGIFTPAVISVAFLANGVTVGVLLFVGILSVATVGRVIMKKLRLPSMPRMALLIWFVSMGVMGLILASPWLRLEGLMQINIFPILLLVLLVETFIEVQITTTFKNALTMTVQTFVLALISFLVISTQTLQEWVLLNPELSVLLIVLLDIFIGRYDGLRLLERWRFRKLLEK